MNHSLLKLLKQPVCLDVFLGERQRFILKQFQVDFVLLDVVFRVCLLHVAFEASVDHVVSRRVAVVIEHVSQGNQAHTRQCPPVSSSHADFIAIEK